jgi:hypothetical protein
VGDLHAPVPLLLPVGRDRLEPPAPLVRRVPGFARDALIGEQLVEPGGDAPALVVSAVYLRRGDVVVLAELLRWRGRSSAGGRGARRGVGCGAAAAKRRG